MRKLVLQRNVIAPCESRGCNEHTPGPMRHRRIVISEYGGPDVLHVVEEEAPEPRADEIRVKVLVSGVAMPDIMAREGIHPETPKVPFTPGWDLVGVVERCGDQVSAFTAGQVVAAMPISGAYAEYL